MKIRLVIFDWSSVISDDRMPVYNANMRLLKDHGKPAMNFEEWLPETMMTVMEFMEKFGVNEDPNDLFKRYKEYLDEEWKKGSGIPL